MKLVFLGPPGSGKGTQANLLSKKLNIPHISTGDIFRENLSKKTKLGKKAAEYMNKGFLVPDNVTNAMVEHKLKEIKGYILDGYPRTIPQAEFLDNIQQLDKVINFKLDDAEVIKRISGRRTCINCGAVYHIYYSKPKTEGVCDKCNHELKHREDEQPEIVRKRLDVYKQQTEPLIEYYKKILINIDASPSIKKVNKILNGFFGKA